MSRPSIDHSILSPSGRVSGRARQAALRRIVTELFPVGYWTGGEPQQDACVADLQAAVDLRLLAARGMSPRKHLKTAEALEAKWEPKP